MKPAPPIPWAAHYASLVGRFGPRHAVMDLDGTASYAALIGRAAGIARRLVEAGVAPGERVASFLANGRAAVACGIAAQIAGAAEMPLNIGSTEAERVTMLGVAPVRHVVCARADAGFFADHGLVVHHVEDIAPEPLEAARFPPVGADLPGRILFTSGTSGTPKAVLYTQRNRLLAHILLRASQPFAAGPGDAILLMTPYAHGASLQAHAWLDHGATLALLPGVVTERVEAWLSAGALSAVFAAPTVLAKLAASFPGRHFPGIRAVFTGTAPLTPRIHDQAAAMFGPVIRVTYGKTEVINPIAVLPPAECAAHFAEGGGADGASCVGWPEAGVELALDADGEVMIRAQHMSDGTIDAAGLHPWEPDGFHPSGDIGRFDARGRLHLVARVSDAMKSGGYKVYPQEIERALAAAVPSELVVLGLASEYWGEVIAAVAEAPDPGWEGRARDAVACLAPWKRPRFLLAMPELPRNAQGKLVRRVLRDEIARRYRLIDGPHPRLEPA